MKSFNEWLKENKKHELEVDMSGLKIPKKKRKNILDDMEIDLSKPLSDEEIKAGNQSVARISRNVGFGGPIKKNN